MTAYWQEKPHEQRYNRPVKDAQTLRHGPSLPDLLALTKHREGSLDEWIRQLLSAESADRLIRSIRYQLAIAKFPNHRDLTGFEFEHSPVDQRLIHELH